jgi:hypothetical protein
MPASFPLLIRRSQCRAPGVVVSGPGLDLPGAAADWAILYIFLVCAAATVDLQLNDFATVGALQRHAIIHDVNDCMGTSGSPEA